MESIVNEHRDEAKRLLAEGKVREIEFSGGTYQMQVADDEEVWPFIQFDEQEKLSDSFCSCEAAEEGASCPHLAAALLRIYNSKRDPLHRRFDRSLWNQLCRIYADRQGYETSILKQEEETYFIETVTGKRLFTAVGKTPEALALLKKLIEEREKQTEETSLKFSGLSIEELSLWREGRPSKQLLYELSFWSDLAKWLMVMQDEGESYTITFDYSENGVPNEIGISVDGLDLSFYISEANLTALIPSLHSVEAPLKVHHLQDEAIEQITYDRERGVLQIHPKEGVEVGPTLIAEEQVKDRIELDNWYLVPGDGFYSKEQHTLLLNLEIPPEGLGGILEQHAHTVANHLIGETIHTEPLHPKYDLWFDDEWNLHFSTYIYDRRDLQVGSSRIFGSWVYLDDDGFYPLQGARFDQGKLVVPSAEVSDFVHKNRVWLNSKEGFESHLTTIESHLSYAMSKEEGLTFEARIDLSEETSRSHDFGDWVYIEGQGFYSKRRGRVRSRIQAGVEIPKEEVGVFVKLHRDELDLVPGFFGEICPIVKGTLRIMLGLNHILIVPEYELFPEYTKENVHFFEEYVCVDDRGFCEIPKTLLLPEGFRDTTKLVGQEMQLFLTYELDKLEPFISHLDPRLRKIKEIHIEIADVQQGGAGERGLLSLNMLYRSHLGTISIGEVSRHLNSGQRYLFSEAGLLDLQDPRFQWLRQINPSLVDRGTNIVKLTTLEFLRLHAVEQIEYAAASENARELLTAFSELRPPESPDLSGLVSELRHYQQIGVEWLWFLYHHSLSGLLCDDMGLGKTHQAMALMAAIFNDHLQDKQRPKYLVVCPTSVIYHWKEKLEQYLPSAKVYTFYGSARSLREAQKCDVVLTSYGILRTEKAKLHQIPFDLAVYDEIQVAKNHNSQTYKVLAGIKSKMRLGLTGTPIENSLRELKSLFDLVLPTYLPTDAQFRETFTLPIERDHDEERKGLLRQIVRPFILRRKKEEVLKELPEKMEELAHCDLSPEQQRLYNQVISGTTHELLAELKDDSKNVSYVHIFALLTSLKRVCDHPAVYLKKPQAYSDYPSGKWDLFCELLSQARESRQKVVVFSQYLDMLDIIELYLRERNIGYASIRGATQRRDVELKRFSTDPRCEVFVGSLQAAGLGIDLTAASVVIHYDRWWTKAREAQATDRVHRLGQTRGVQVFKLLTLGTLEEKIDAIIERKGKLLEEVVGTDEKSQLKAFSREELADLLTLFEPAAEP